MTAREIYDHFQINTGLREHMIRVSAVAKRICDAATIDLDEKAVIEAALVHDLGNLIKAVNMEQNPSLYEPEGIAYWQARKEAVIAQYGSSVDQATKTMAESIGISDETLAVLQAIGNEPTERVAETGTLEEKIANYSDMRVGLHNIISLEERIADLRVRYAHRGQDTITKRAAWLHDIETDIFSQATITPTDITDDSTAEIQTALWNWEIKTAV